MPWQTSGAGFLNPKASRSVPKQSCELTAARAPEQKQNQGSRKKPLSFKAKSPHKRAGPVFSGVYAWRGAEAGSFMPTNYSIVAGWNCRAMRARNWSCKRS
jgi:hypothetical protein